MSKLIRRLFSKTRNYYCIQNESNGKKEDFYCIIVNNDKIVFLVEIDELIDLQNYTMKLPTLKDLIYRNLLDEKESKYVTNDARVIDSPKREFPSENEKQSEEQTNDITIPAFLWDLYAVGFYKVRSNKFYPIEEVENVKRDQFIARKVIVQYSSLRELVDIFYENIYPERIISSILQSLAPPVIDINKIMNNIDLNSISATHVAFKNKEASDIGSDLIVSYLDDIIESYLK